MGRIVSHGRGGAGNIYSKEAPSMPKDLVTPTIKQDIFTTGRGGSGNMMHNDPERPEIARESQDVGAPPLRAEQAPHHIGRGGAANAYIPTAEEEERARQEAELQLQRVRTQSKDRLKEYDIEQAERHTESSSSS
ncbi:hypothetical protein AWENTII_001947 [Aspergillus wentii]|nr:hypothetical protein MW887_010011 [Aspergillus wentii]